MTHDPPANLIIDGRFQVQSVLGVGGMGTVYLCKQLGIERLVAVKVLRAELGGHDPDALPRFEREAQALSRLHHKFIVAMYGYGQHQGEPYIAMEYVQGKSLGSLLAANKPLPIEQAIAIIAQVCEALVCAHGNGFIHRDLKPSNIIVTDDGGIKLIDFGLLKLSAKSSIKDQQLTEAGTAIGSVLYMSPEQCIGQTTDERSDLYGLGCVMFHCLTGVPPFQGDASVAVMHQHFSEPLPRLSDKLGFDPRLPLVQRILDMATAKQPGERYTSAQHMHDDLQRLQQGMSIEAPALPKPAPGKKSAAGKMTRRQVVTGLVAAALLGSAAVGYYIFRTASAEKELAELSVKTDELRSALSRSKAAQDSMMIRWKLGKLFAKRADLVGRGNEGYESLRRDALMNCYLACGSDERARTAPQEYIAEVRKTLSWSGYEELPRMEAARSAGACLLGATYAEADPKRKAEKALLGESLLEPYLAFEDWQTLDVWAQLKFSHAFAIESQRRFDEALKHYDDLQKTLDQHKDSALLKVHPLLRRFYLKRLLILPNASADLDKALKIGLGSDGRGRHLVYLGNMSFLLSCLLEEKRKDDAEKLWRSMLANRRRGPEDDSVIDDCNCKMAMLSADIKRVLAAYKQLDGDKMDKGSLARVKLQYGLLLAANGEKEKSAAKLREAEKIWGELNESQNSREEQRDVMATYLIRTLAPCGMGDAALRIAEGEIARIPQAQRSVREIGMRHSYVFGIWDCAPAFCQALIKPLEEERLMSLLRQDGAARAGYLRDLAELKVSQHDYKSALDLMQQADKALRSVGGVNPVDIGILERRLKQIEGFNHK